MRRRRKVYLPEKIVSGGQTGVDRAGLDVAIALGLAYGGWCPRGRRAEDGEVPSRYELIECDSYHYQVRTELNVQDSDATLILYERELKGGTLLTARLASEKLRPYLCMDLQLCAPELAQSWLQEIKPRVLNIAGPRESMQPGIYERAFDWLLQVFQTELDHT